MFLQMRPWYFATLAFITSVFCNSYNIPLENSWSPGRYYRPMDYMVDVTNRLGISVLHEHNFLNDNNIAFSPYGLTGILIALYEGVDGYSALQIRDAMRIPADRNVLRVGFRDIYRRLRSYFIPEEGFLAGLTFNKDNVTFRQDYLNILRYYGYDFENTNPLTTQSTVGSTAPQMSETFSATTQSSNGFETVSTTRNMATSTVSMTTQNPTQTTTKKTETTQTTTKNTATTQTTTKNPATTQATTKNPATTQTTTKNPATTQTTTKNPATTQTTTNKIMPTTKRKEEELNDDAASTTETREIISTTRRKNTDATTDSQKITTAKTTESTTRAPATKKPEQKPTTTSKESEISVPLSAATTTSISSDQTTIYDVTSTTETKEIISTTGRGDTEPTTDSQKITTVKTTESTTRAPTTKKPEQKPTTISKEGEISVPLSAATTASISSDQMTIYDVTSTTETKEIISTTGRRDTEATTDSQKITTKSTTRAPTTINQEQKPTTTSKEDDVSVPLSAETTSSIASDQSTIPDSTVKQSTTETETEKNTIFISNTSFIMSSTPPNLSENTIVILDNPDDNNSETPQTPTISSTTTDKAMTNTRVSRSTNNAVTSSMTNNNENSMTDQNTVLTIKETTSTMMFMDDVTELTHTNSEDLTSATTEMSTSELANTITTSKNTDLTDISTADRVRRSTQQMTNIFSSPFENTDMGSTIMKPTNMGSTGFLSAPSVTNEAFSTFEVTNAPLMSTVSNDPNTDNEFTDVAVAETTEDYKLTIDQRNPENQINVTRKKRTLYKLKVFTPLLLDRLGFFRPLYRSPSYNDGGLQYHSYFMANGYDKVQISYMTYDTILEFAYVPHLKSLAVKLPLDTMDYYLLIILPDHKFGINDLVNDLRSPEAPSLRNIYNMLSDTHVRAWVPSFMLKGSIVLTNDLQKLGICDVFEPRQDDFKPMTDQRNVYARNIEQAITVTIRKYMEPNVVKRNEPWTRRKKHFLFSKGYAYNRQPVEFAATHPFLFFVMDSSLHVALMAGKVVNPLNSRIL